MVGILRPSDREIVAQRFEEELDSEVQMTLVTHTPIGGLLIPGRDCESCEPTKQLVQEVVDLSPKLTLNEVDFYRESEKAAELGVDKIPALVVHYEDRNDVKFYGLPAGYEFTVLLDTITSASSDAFDLSDETLAKIESLEEDVHIQVFVTPN